MREWVGVAHIYTLTIFLQLYSNCEQIKNDTVKEEDLHSTAG